MNQDLGSARRDADRIRAAATWRHPTRLSAVVWLYLGSGSERIWSAGEPVEPGAGAEDWPYLAENAADGLPAPVRGAAESAASAILEGLMPQPKEIVAALHSRDFAPPSDMPALRFPYDIAVSHLAGALVACHVMLACAPLTLEPAAARRSENRRRFARGLHLATSLVAVRGAEDAVGRSAALLMDGVAVRVPVGAGNSDLSNPTMSGD
jgi:hypothetical protein